MLSLGLHGADSLNPVDWIDCGQLTITEDMIGQFAALTDDRFEIHMSDAAARAHGFYRRVAHELLILSLVDGMKTTRRLSFARTQRLGLTVSQTSFG